MAVFYVITSENFKILSYNKRLRDQKKSFVKIVRRPPLKKICLLWLAKKRWQREAVVGNERISNKEIVDAMHDMYERYWNPLKNYFMLAHKIKRKEKK